MKKYYGNYLGLVVDDEDPDDGGAAETENDDDDDDNNDDEYAALFLAKITNHLEKTLHPKNAKVSKNRWAVLGLYQRMIQLRRLWFEDAQVNGFWVPKSRILEDIAGIEPDLPQTSKANEKDNIDNDDEEEVEDTEESAELQAEEQPEDIDLQSRFKSLKKSEQLNKEELILEDKTLEKQPVAAAAVETKREIQNNAEAEVNAEGNADHM